MGEPNSASQNRSVVRAGDSALHADFLERTSMSIGMVKWFNRQKGYGSIQPQDGSQEVSVHVSAVARSGLGNWSQEIGSAIAWNASSRTRFRRSTSGPGNASAQ